MTMRRMLAVVMVCMAVGTVKAEVSPDDVLRAIDQMTPEQVMALSHKLESRFWEPIPTGFFTRMAIDVAVGGSQVHATGVDRMALSGGTMDVDDPAGVDIGILWRFNDPRQKMGIRFGSLTARDSNLGDAGYSRADLVGSHVVVPWHMQWLRSASFSLWTEASVGVGYVQIDTVDTPAGSGSTVRTLDREFVQGDLQAGASWYLNPAVNVFLAGGYRFADSVQLEEGGRKTDLKYDGSGPFGRIGLGVNF